ncbi:hypothetical protein FN846DRAFT_58898 [Sphaerosporella brunnea]|uniref:Secreted protein n=1 Tax=Sphaerosporella brunnea TaxID=1250544 RepID=A0A5J5F9G8_9PEZI|nr:hypothetical protein FN846DRAFT_58898 [Sphaerosporella brunnea]
MFLRCRWAMSALCAGVLHVPWGWGRERVWNSGHPETRIVQQKQSHIHTRAMMIRYSAGNRKALHAHTIFAKKKQTPFPEQKGNSHSKKTKTPFPCQNKAVHLTLRLEFMSKTTWNKRHDVAPLYSLIGIWHTPSKDAPRHCLQSIQNHTRPDGIQGI